MDTPAVGKACEHGYSHTEHSVGEREEPLPTTPSPSPLAHTGHPGTSVEAQSFK